MTTPAVDFNYYDIAKPMTYLPAMLLAAPVVANRHWLKSLGLELEAIAREESRKAGEAFGDLNINDIERRKNSGKEGRRDHHHVAR